MRGVLWLGLAKAYTVAMIGRAVQSEIIAVAVGGFGKYLRWTKSLLILVALVGSGCDSPTMPTVVDVEYVVRRNSNGPIAAIKYSHPTGVLALAFNERSPWSSGVLQFQKGTPLYLEAQILGLEGGCVIVEIKMKARTANAEGCNQLAATSVAANAE